jgi:CYTH domain-containing protein
VEEWRRTPGLGKYARPERERRFVVTGAASADGPVLRIEDRYLIGMQLRLRRIAGDGDAVFKLTQKVRANHDDPFEVATTNIYLSQSEYEQLLVLPALVLIKSRQVVDVEGTRFAIDDFEGPLLGLRLAEVEVPDRDALLPQPPWLGREVTDDDRYSGGRLATAADREGLG